MMGHSYECTDCDFEFCSGWSHHAGGQLRVRPARATHIRQQIHPVNLIRSRCLLNLLGIRQNPVDV
ncbi:MAG: hypothetical protein JWP89_1106 [Schlesneria sp.]|nr:hypothetical protein [Schlesneria sp.]